MAHHVAPLRWFGRATLAALGWKLVGEAPRHPRVVLICAPHTSNWDFVLMLLISWAMDFGVHWIGKDSLFKPPFAGLMRALGGIAVQRGARSNQSGQVAERMKAATRADAARPLAQIIVAIAPEGTRSRAPHWRSGFYHIASQADATIALGFLDYTLKVGGFGPELQPSGDLQADFAQIAAFYAGKRGRFADQQGPIAVQSPAARQEQPPGR